MNQEEDTQTMKESFNITFNESEILPTKKSNKLKYTIIIISSVIALAAAATLLVGYFKFNWFKDEIYTIDANITRSLHQANYFTENRKITTKIAITEDEYEEQEYLIDTDFMVFLNERKQLEKGDYLNTASIVLLKSKMTSNEEEQNLPSLDLSDAEKIKEFETNPDGSKYPRALFKFYENGTIDEIKVPDTIDQYNAETIKELIEKVIPRLSRNRTEDENNGLDIKTKKDRKKKTMIEEEKPKQYYDFKRSRFSKAVERDFVDDELTNIRTNADIHLQTIPEEEDQKVYGAKDIELSDEAKEQLKEFERLGYGKYPVCIAKTQYSLSDDPKNLLCEDDYIIHVRELQVRTGAEFVVAITGKIFTMPGLPKVPAAEKIDLDDDGNIVGLF